MPPCCHTCSIFSVFIDLLVYFSVFVFFFGMKAEYIRGVSNGLCEHLRACEQCVSFDLFLQARAVIDVLMRTASTLELQMASSEHFVQIAASWNLSSLKHCFAPSNLADTFKTGQQG